MKCRSCGCESLEVRKAIKGRPESDRHCPECGEELKKSPSLIEK